MVTPAPADRHRLQRLCRVACSTRRPAGGAGVRRRRGGRRVRRGSTSAGRGRGGRRRGRRGSGARARAGRRDLVTLLDAGVRHVGAVLEPGAHLEALVEGEVGVEHVEATVVGVAARRDVPVAEVLGVHRRHHAAPPPAVAGHEVGDEPVQPPVDEDGAEVDRQLHRRRPSAGVPRRRCRRACGTGRRRGARAAGPGSPARRAAVTIVARLGVGAHHHAVSGQRPGLAPGLTLRDRQPDSPPRLVDLDGRAGRHHAAVQRVGGLPGASGGGRDRRDVADARAAGR